MGRMFAVQTIVFIRDFNKQGQEISGYIDFGQRLKDDKFEQYFELKKRVSNLSAFLECINFGALSHVRTVRLVGLAQLLPRSTDLSYYNWETQVAHATSSPNFQVITDNEMGLLFKNKRDRKIINVDPEV